MLKKSKKTAELEDIGFSGVIINLDETVRQPDQDELQLMDELDEEWVEIWCKMVNKSRTQKNERHAVTEKRKKATH